MPLQWWSNLGTRNSEGQEDEQLNVDWQSATKIYVIYARIDWIWTLMYEVEGKILTFIGKVPPKYVIDTRIELLNLNIDVWGGR